MDAKTTSCPYRGQQSVSRAQMYSLLFSICFTLQLLLLITNSGGLDWKQNYMKQVIRRVDDNDSESGPVLLNKYGDLYSVYNCARNLHGKAENGSLPHFIVAGVHKGGSTALFGYLSRHGHVRPSVCKETNFFTEEKLYAKGIQYYRRHFPDLSTAKELHHMITGEGTPNYIRNPIAPLRIRKMLPNIKIIISLRNPVQRFVSHYVGQVENKGLKVACNEYFEEDFQALDSCVSAYSYPERNKEKFLKMEEKRAELYSKLDKCNSSLAVLDEAPRHQRQIVGASASMYDPRYRVIKGPARARAKGCLLNMDNRNPNNDSCIVHECLSLNPESPLSRGVYVDQIERWLEHFPPENIMVVQAEHLYANTSKTMQDVAEFLGIRPYNSDELREFESTFKGSNHTSNPLELTCNKIRSRLEGFYQEHNELLYKLLRKNWPDRFVTVPDKHNLWM